MGISMDAQKSMTAGAGMNTPDGIHNQGGHRWSVKPETVMVIGFSGLLLFTISSPSAFWGPTETIFFGSAALLATAVSLDKRTAYKFVIRPISLAVLYGVGPVAAVGLCPVFKGINTVLLLQFYALMLLSGYAIWQFIKKRA